MQAFSSYFLRAYCIFWQTMLYCMQYGYEIGGSARACRAGCGSAQTIYGYEAGGRSVAGVFRSRWAFGASRFGGRAFFFGRGVLRGDAPKPERRRRDRTHGLERRLRALFPASGGKMNYALVTGATGGLGRQFAYLLAERGEALLLTGRSAEKLASLREEIEDRRASLFPARQRRGCGYPEGVCRLHAGETALSGARQFRGGGRSCEICL